MRRLQNSRFRNKREFLDVVQIADIVFWSVAIDIKYKDVENTPDEYINFFNGSIRNLEQEHMAKLLRQKSKTLDAFTSCAHECYVSGSANLHDSKEILNTSKGWIHGGKVDNCVLITGDGYQSLPHMLWVHNALRGRTNAVNQQGL